MTDLKKKLRKRWGKKHLDDRDWREYNKQLVKRGEYLLDLDWVESWNDELERVNEGKVGKPFTFPDSLIRLQAIWHAKGLPYRAIKGITKQLARFGRLPAYNDYSTVNRRVNDLDFQLELPQSNNLVLFSDGTGLQAVAGGEYLREKHGKKNRRWIQVVLLGDAETHEPVSYEVNLIPSSEPESTSRQADGLLAAGTSIAALGGDGALDKKDLWNQLETNGIKSIIKPDENARDDTDCPTRNKTVKQRNKLGYKKWARQNKYGHRWPATEGIFSAVKRIFGEQLKAKKEKGMLQEAASKIWAYQKLKRHGEAHATT